MAAPLHSISHQWLTPTMISPDILYVILSLCIFAFTKVFEHMGDLSTAFHKYFDVSTTLPAPYPSKEGPFKPNPHSAESLRRPPSPRPPHSFTREPFLEHQLSAPVRSDIVTFRTIPNHEALIKRLQRSNSYHSCANKGLTVSCTAWRINRKKNSFVEKVSGALAAKRSKFLRHGHNSKLERRMSRPGA